MSTDSAQVHRDMERVSTSGPHGTSAGTAIEPPGEGAASVQPGEDAASVAHPGGDAVAQAHPNYVKIWVILLGLLAISLVGPLVGIKWITLIAAFGVAVVKALMVAGQFMHLNVEKRYISYALITCLAFLLVLFAGVSPDVLKHDGENWSHVSKVNE